MKAKKVASPVVGQESVKPDGIPVSVNDVRTKPYEGVKTSGVKTRGNGAATKGTTARGPMA